MLIPQAYAQTAAAQPQGGGLFLPLMMIVIVAFMYFTTIRPQRKRQKEHAAMVAALKKGDEVALSSGMLGKISGLDDNYLVLSVGNNVDLKFQKVHVTSVLPKGTLKSVGVESA
jgi:preprotein translocase subunit YajC|tara:strand:- start:178 stop:519 length:342 start_codon:yes stop_codon:yes gene_type:complete